ncbi:MAG: ribonuclease HII [Candidatus Kariarchaeaceae archaeon]|jgi:ribonuclease HII
MSDISITNLNLIAGMDEAGRGPAIGPIVFGLVLVTKSEENKLRSLGIDDSKALTANRRSEFENKIKGVVSYHSVVSVPASKINEFMLDGINLNQIEVNEFKALVKPHVKHINKLQIDAADVNEERFGSHFIPLIEGEVISKHKADTIFPAVSAASILAKVERDRRIKLFQQEYLLSDPDLPSFGSGYPQDARPFLLAYVKKHRELPPIARKLWKTCTRIIDEILGPKQSSLDMFE